MLEASSKENDSVCRNWGVWSVYGEVLEEGKKDIVEETEGEIEGVVVPEWRWKLKWNPTVAQIWV